MPTTKPNTDAVEKNRVTPPAKVIALNNQKTLQPKRSAHTARADRSHPIPRAFVGSGTIPRHCDVPIVCHADAESVGGGATGDTGSGRVGDGCRGGGDVGGAMSGADGMGSGCGVIDRVDGGGVGVIAG